MSVLQALDTGLAFLVFAVAANLKAEERLFIRAVGGD